MDDEQGVKGSSRVENAGVFVLRNNYALSPDDAAVRQQLSYCEDYLHGSADGIVGTTATERLSPTSLVSLFNVQGQMIWQGRYGSLPSLPTGVYLVRAGKIVEKVLIH